MDKYILLGKLNGTDYINAWEYDLDDKVLSGDYAIVENKNDYDLVKVMLIGIIDDKYSKFMTNDKKLKKVVKVIKRETIRED